MIFSGNLTHSLEKDTLCHIKAIVSYLHLFFHHHLGSIVSLWINIVHLLHQDSHKVKDLLVLWTVGILHWQSLE